MLCLTALAAEADDDNKSSMTWEGTAWDGAVEVAIPIAVLQKGDANGDGYVNAADITETVNYILGKPSELFVIRGADVNDDGIIDDTDVKGIANIIMQPQQ